MVGVAPTVDKLKENRLGRPVDEMVRRVIRLWLMEMLGGGEDLK